jgi:hypothetical protein
MQRLEEGSFLVYKVDDIFLADGTSVNAYPFTEINEVGRGVQTYAVAAFL